MAGSGSIRFSPAVHLPSPKHLAFASPGNDAGGSIPAAKVAHFLAATDTSILGSVVDARADTATASITAVGGQQSGAGSTQVKC